MLLINVLLQLINISLELRLLLLELKHTALELKYTYSQYQSIFFENRKAYAIGNEKNLPVIEEKAIGLINILDMNL